MNSFAEFLGASRPIVSMWTLGERPITEAYKKKIAAPLAELVGPKAYEILNVVPSDPDLQRLTQIWQYLPEKIRRSFIKQGEKYANENTNEEKDTAKHTA